MVSQNAGSVVGLVDGMSSSLGGSPLFNKEIQLNMGTPHEGLQHSVPGGSAICFDVSNAVFYIQDDSDSGSSWKALRTV